MTAKELKDKIKTMQAGLDSGSIPDSVRSNLEAAIKKAQAQLADLEKGDDKPAPTPQPKVKARKPKTEKQNKKPRKPKAQAAPLDCAACDKNGKELQVGDLVKVAFKKGTVEATVHSLAKNKGAGNTVRFDENGKTVHRPAHGKNIEFVSRPEAITFEKKIPAELVKTAEVVNRTDCDENQVILVTPTEPVAVNVPLVADPEKGEKVIVNKKGHPMGVATAAAAKNDYKKAATAQVTETPGGAASFTIPESEAPEQAAQPRDDDDKRKYDDVKEMRPPKACKITQQAAKTPALMTFLEGMRQRWHSAKSFDKITRVLYHKDKKRIILEIDKYNVIDWNIGLRYYFICLESGRLTQTDKPAAGETSVLMSKDAMKEFYRHPHSAVCQRVSKALYVECYRNGSCSTEKQKRLYAIFATKCAKQELAHSREYLKWLHAETSKRWKGPNSGQSYAEVFRQVAAKARAGK